MPISIPETGTFPVSATVNQAFQLTIANWRNVVKVAWAWLPLISAVGIAYGMNIPMEGEAPSAAFVLWSLLIFVFCALAFGSIAVAWHRLILLGEQPPWINLKIGGEVPRYVGRALLASFGAAGVLMVGVALLILLTSMPSHVIPGSPPTSQGTFQFVYAIMFLLMLLVVGRLFIALPGTAVGKPISFRRAWDVTRGNAWRLLGGTILVWVPGYIIGLFTNLIVAEWAEGTTDSRLLLLAFLQCVGFLAAVIWISYVSLSYRFFVPDASAKLTRGAVGTAAAP